jgi:RecB family exonuclease
VGDPITPPPELVQRVSCAIDGSICPDPWLHQDAARAAIREVAAWLRERGTRVTASVQIAGDLEQEALDD